MTLFSMTEWDETQAHSFRVGCLAEKYGKFLQLSPDTLNAFILAAFLHDTGKHQLDPSVLYQKEPLTFEQRKHVESHVELSQQVLDYTLLPPLTILLILQHHEVANGTGYPNQLKQVEIHPLSFHLSLLDRYDAISQTRCYRAACDESQTFSWLKEVTPDRIPTSVFQTFEAFYREYIAGGYLSF